MRILKGPHSYLGHLINIEFVELNLNEGMINSLGVNQSCELITWTW